DASGGSREAQLDLTHQSRAAWALGGPASRALPAESVRSSYALYDAVAVRNDLAARGLRRVGERVPNFSSRIHVAATFEDSSHCSEVSMSGQESPNELPPAARGGARSGPACKKPAAPKVSSAEPRKRAIARVGLHGSAAADQASR